MKEPEKYLPMNRAELIARCEAQEAVLRKFLACSADKSLNQWEPILAAQELLK